MRRSSILLRPSDLKFLLAPTTHYVFRYSPFGRAGGDMAALFVASCRKYGITPGFYVAVANNAHLNIQNNQPRGGAPLTLTQYEDLVLQMLRELWTNYGPIGEHWFDGGYPQNTAWAQSVADLFAQLQPNAVMFQGPGAQAVRWAGTEGGNAADPNWSTAASSLAYGPGSPNATGFFPANCDTTLQEGDQWRVPLTRSSYPRARARTLTVNRNSRSNHDRHRSYNPAVGLRSLAELISVYHTSESPKPMPKPDL